MSLDVNFPGTTSGSPHSDNGRLIEGKQSNINSLSIIIFETFFLIDNL